MKRLIASAKGGYVRPHLFVGLFVSRITEILPNGFPPNVNGGWVSVQSRPHQLLGQIQDFFSLSSKFLKWIHPRSH